MTRLRDRGVFNTKNEINPDINALKRRAKVPLRFVAVH